MEEASTVAQHSSGVNWVDVSVIALMLISAIFAMIRGFVKEGFVLVSLVCGAIVASKMYPLVQPWMREQMTSRIAADLATWLGVFVLTLVVFIPISSFFVEKVQGNAMTAIDRSLGFVFGLLRGLLIACLLYLLAAQFWDKPKDAPYWIKEAKTKQILNAGAELIKDLVPIKSDRDGDGKKDGRDDEGAGLGDDEEDTPEGNKRKADELLNNLIRPEPEVNKNQPGYDDKTRKNLDDLIEKKTTP